MLKYGFEREYFIVTTWNDSLCWSDKINQTFFRLCPNDIPKDECGYLAEARGEPHEDPYSAAHLMLAEEDRLRKQTAKHGYALMEHVPTVRLPRLLLREALRMYGKPGYSDQRHNMYGLDYSVNNSWNRAALHIHFSNMTVHTYKNKDGEERNYTTHHPLDMCKYIRALDVAFRDEIKAARRLPGFYEMKPHGFEYRSLPTSVDPIKVAEVIRSIK